MFEKAIGLPRVLLANVFLRSIEETLEREGKMASFYKRHVDDTLTITSDTTSATTFLHVLNNCHSSAKVTMVVRISFLMLRWLQRDILFSLLFFHLRLSCYFLAT